MQVKIDSRGRVTIPEAIRATLGFTDIAYLEVEGNKIIITKEYDPIRVIDDMLNDVNKCSAKMEYIDILYEAKKKMEDL
jgi:AbrB family looped-hinge helix DNA binding protein